MLSNGCIASTIEIARSVGEGRDYLSRNFAIGIPRSQRGRFAFFRRKIVKYSIYIYIYVLSEKWISIMSRRVLLVIARTYDVLSRHYCLRVCVCIVVASTVDLILDRETIGFPIFSNDTDVKKKNLFLTRDPSA